MTAEFLLSTGVKLVDQIINSEIIGPVQLITDADYYGRFLL